MRRMKKEISIDSAEDQSGNNCEKINSSTDHESVINHYGKVDKNHSSIIIAEIPSDIQFKILSYLPPKSLFRFKCVSKEFRSLIVLEYSRRKAANAIAFTGFFAWDREGNYEEGFEPSFISTITTDISTISTDAGGGLPDSSLSFLKENPLGSLEEEFKLIDSCNGLLLYEIRTKFTYYTKRELYVCNPLTKQKVFVRHPRIRGIVHPWGSSYNHFALIAQSTSMGYLHYKVVYIDGGHIKHSKLWMFSSETGEWEHFRYRLPSVDAYLMAKRQRIFIKGTTLIWDCFASGKYILICYLNKKMASSSRGFDLIECPCDYQNMRSLWDYNGKIFFYFNERRAGNRELGKLSAWSLCFVDNNNIGWKKEDPLQLKTLAKDLSKYWFKKEYPGLELLPEIQIVGYIANLKTMYISIGGVVFSYELVERRFEIVWIFKCGRYETCVVFPYIHSLEPIEIGITNTADDETLYGDIDDADDYPICVVDDGLELID